jgi:radical SAM protein with 4Fe4S-binding SPASM domain
VELQEPTAPGCYGYGFYDLEHSAALAYRWSRRWFGFYFPTRDVQHLVLDIAFPAAAILRSLRIVARVNGRLVLACKLSRNSDQIAIDIPSDIPGPVLHVAFELERTWQAPPGDTRKLGIQLLGLTIRTGSQAVTHPIEHWGQNCSRVEFVRYADFFRSATSASGNEAMSNAALNVTERTREDGHVRSTPLKLYLEIAWLCHLRCPSCFHAYIPHDAGKAALHFMTSLLYRRVVDALFGGALMVWFSGNGESLLHPAIEAILGTARDFRFIPAMLTSGSLFTEQNMRRLVEGGFFLSISVDSPHEGTFDRLRKGARFSKVVAAIESMQALRHSLKQRRFNLRVQCVAQQANLRQLADLVTWAASMGIEEVQFLPLQNFGMPHAYLRDAKLQRTPELANQAMLDAIRTGTKRGVRVRPFPLLDPTGALASQFEEAVSQNLRRPIAMDEWFGEIRPLAEHPANRADHTCHLAWSECFIGVDGGIAPCDMYLAETTMGNLLDEDFTAIWNSPRMVAMRKSVNVDPRGLCRHGTCMFRPARAFPQSGEPPADEIYPRG